MTTEPRPEDVDRAREGIRRQARETRRHLLLSAVFVVLLAPLLVWVQGWTLGLVLTAIGAIALAGIFFVVLAPWVRRARRAERSDADLVAFHRTELERSLREIRRLLPFIWISLPLCAAAVVVKFASGASPDLREEILLVVLVAGVATSLVHTATFRRRRLEREIRDLDA